VTGKLWERRPANGYVMASDVVIEDRKSHQKNGMFVSKSVWSLESDDEIM
jgi:hypothetical protein